MQENLLKYIWQYQQFTKQKLTTSQGQPIKIIKMGIPNTNAGPDFLQAKLYIDNVIFHGNIELHVHATNWYKHNHHQDPAYHNVILHVVWEYDKPVVKKDGTLLPTLALKKYTNSKLLDRYQNLLQNSAPIPCTKSISKVPIKKWYVMLDKAILKRLSHKYKLVYQLLEASKNDSESTIYQLLAYNFGFKINSPTFLQLSKIVPIKIIQKNANNLLYLEALLLGQAGLLAPELLPTKIIQDEYLAKVISTYNYLKHKYKLKTTLNHAQWKFGKLRPPNSPFIRIAQFATLLHKHPAIFDLLINTSFKDLYEKLSIQQSSYWQEHYKPGKKSKKNLYGLGKASIENILINTVVPMLVAYGELRNTNYYTDLALSILKCLPPEKNFITKKWINLGMPIQNALASQASLELFNNFCSLKKCLSCTVGKSLLTKIEK